MNSYENLANAIILSAVNDYREVLKELSYFPEDEKALQKKQSCERFFRSSWFGALTTIDSEKLISKLQQEA